MNEMIERLKAGSTKYVSGTVWMDSHERFEYFHRLPSGSAKYDRPCRWIITGTYDGYLVEQYDLSLFMEEINGTACWNNPSDIEIMEREMFSSQMNLVGRFCKELPEMLSLCK